MNTHDDKFDKFVSDFYDTFHLSKKIYKEELKLGAYLYFEDLVPEERFVFKPTPYTLTALNTKERK